MRMKKFLAIAAISTSLAGFGSAGWAADVEAPASGVLFGHITGAYILEDPWGNWTIFQPDYSEEGLGDGFLVRGLIGYRWSDWDVAVGGQYADLSRGPLSEGPFPVDGDMSAKNFAIDGEFGYNTSVWNSDVRLFLGVRYAEWDHTVFPTSGAGPVSHDFSGVGPRIGYSAVTPLSDSLTLETAGAVAVLFGEIKTSAGPGWNCGQCSDQDTTSLNLESSIGIGFGLGESARAVIGWQNQYWDNVNVGVTDASGGGLNQGKSDHFMTGPFLRLAF
jgi:hypothetical protein